MGECRENASCRENVHVVRYCLNRGRLRIDENPRKGTKKEGNFSEEKTGGRVLENKECKE